jgi:hypothetical protein
MQSFLAIQRAYPRATNACWVELEAQKDENKTQTLINYLKNESIDLLFLGRDDRSVVCDYREIGIFTSQMLAKCNHTNFFIVSNS